MDFVLSLCLAMTLTGLGFSVLRIFIKTCYANKIIGADFMMTALIAILGIIATYTDNMFYLDVAMLVGIIGFLSTIYFSKFLVDEPDAVSREQACDSQQPYGAKS